MEHQKMQVKYHCISISSTHLVDEVY